MTQHVLHLLPTDWFPDRAAIRDFVAGPRYEGLGLILRVALDEPQYSAPELVARVRGFAYWLLDDLLKLSQVAADDGDFELEHEPLDSVESLRGVVALRRLTLRNTQSDDAHWCDPLDDLADALLAGGELPETNTSTARRSSSSDIEPEWIELSQELRDRGFLDLASAILLAIGSNEAVAESLAASFDPDDLLRGIRALSDPSKVAPVKGPIWHGLWDALEGAIRHQASQTAPREVR